MPQEELTKAQLASQIRQVIKRQRLTQVAAAALMGIDQPKVSALLNGRLANFSSERLMRLLTALGQDVDITVRRSRTIGRTAASSSSAKRKRDETRQKNFAPPHMAGNATTCVLLAFVAPYYAATD